METQKAHKRRKDLGWFDKYIKGHVIDIGAGRFESMGEDLVIPNAVSHDKDICDAHTMEVYAPNTFDCVHASHVLEHLIAPTIAIKNWFRICKPNGHIVISVPHRDIYERRVFLPSRWNPDHKFFILPTGCEPPCTFSLTGIVTKGLVGEDYSIEYLGIANTCTNMDKPEQHGDGEYSIEIIIKKNA